MKVTILSKAEDFYRVEQDEVAIASDRELRTSGLMTCSAMAICQNGKTLLTHVDARSNTDDLIKTIHDNFDLTDRSLKIAVIPGTDATGDFNQSIEKISKVVSDLGLSKQKMPHKGYNNIMDDIVVSPKGSVYSEQRRIPKNEILQEEGIKYVFFTNANMEDVEELPNGDVQLTIGKTSPNPKTEIYQDCIIRPPLGGWQGMVGIFQKQTLPAIKLSGDERMNFEESKITPEILAKLKLDF